MAASAHASTIVELPNGQKLRLKPPEGNLYMTIAKGDTMNGRLVFMGAVPAGDSTARDLGCQPSDVFVASTGVIGEPLDARKFEGVLADCAKRAADGPWSDAAKAIMANPQGGWIGASESRKDGQSAGY